MSKKKQGTAKKAPPTKAKKTQSKRSSNGVGAIQTILNVTATLARLGGSNEVPKEKMVAFVKCQGIVSKSTIANGLTSLKKSGLIIMAPKVITITDKGMNQADSSADLAFATNEEYHKQIQQKMKLSSRACKLMEELADGRVRCKKEVSAAIGCDKLSKSTWANMLTPLKKFKIIEFDRGTIQLTDDMFPFGRPDKK